MIEMNVCSYLADMNKEYKGMDVIIVIFVYDYNYVKLKLQNPSALGGVLTLD